jgi:hypothetical protein
VATSRRWTIVVLALAGSHGCAGGAAPQKGPVATGVGSDATASPESSSGDGDDDETTLVVEETIGDGEAGELEGSSDGEPGESSTSSAGGSGGESSSGGGEDTGAPPSCPQLASCPTATVIGEVSGDQASRTIESSGAEPTWVTFQVTEDNEDVTGEAVSFTATLTSPVGSDFDLYVYRGASGGATGCGGTLEQSTSAGAQDVVHMSWGEGALANGGDDRAWVAIEVVPKDDCDGLAEWTLTVEGDT